MDTPKIRERLHEYIRYADDKKVQAMYTMVENELTDLLNLWGDENFITELDNRLADYETGKITGKNWEEIKATI